MFPLLPATQHVAGLTMDEGKIRVVVSAVVRKELVMTD
jgi:hypothetical protein